MRLCSFEGCEKPLRALGLCSGHRQQKARGEELRPLIRIERGVFKECSVEDCERPHRAKGLCDKHYHSARYQSVAGPPREQVSRPRRRQETRVCSFAGCEKLVHAVGLCSGHATQHYKGWELRPLSTVTYAEQHSLRNRGLVEGEDPGDGQAAIYLLEEMGSGKVRYVGTTTRPLGLRFSGHRFRGHTPELRTWMKKLLPDGIRMRGVEVCPHEEAVQREDTWINKLRAEGHQLLNEERAILPEAAAPVFTSVPAKKPCGFETCDRPMQAKGLCGGHWTQQRKGLPLTPIRAKKRTVPTTCSVEGCGGLYYARGYCRNHHAKALRGVDPSTQYGLTDEQRQARIETEAQEEAQRREDLTARNATIRQLYPNRSYSLAAIGQLVGLSATHVAREAQRLGLSARPIGRPPKQRPHSVVDRHQLVLF
jgi:hypothetical protein